MSIEDADLVQEIIERDQSVTSLHEAAVQREVRKWAAFHETDSLYLKNLKNWPADRLYVPDPLAPRIAEAYADFLASEDPVFTSAEANALKDPIPEADAEVDEDEALGDEQVEGVVQRAGEREGSTGSDDDQDRLDELLNANNFGTELHNAIETMVAEGEVWWRIYKDLEQSDYPVIEWHSRSHVRPIFRGREILAAAFVSDIYAAKEDENLVTWKYVEIQTEGYIRNLLYRGSNGQLGQAISLEERPETAGLAYDWEHDFGLLAGRIENKLGKDKRYGISEYKGVEELLFSLNEATTIGHENARLTLKKRLALPREALNRNGQFDAGEDVLVMDDPLDEDLTGGKSQGKFAVLEYSFDADALIAYKDHTANTILTRVGLARQLTDPNSADGAAATGTALRTRLIPTTLASKGKARSIDDKVPSLVMLAQQIDALDESRGGFGRNWKAPGEPPVMERQDPLPRDEGEETTRHAMAVGAEIESRYQAIKQLHPDWSKEQIDEEIELIYSEIERFTDISAGAGAFGQDPLMGGEPFGAANPALPDEELNPEDGLEPPAGEGFPEARPS